MHFEALGYLERIAVSAVGEEVVYMPRHSVLKLWKLEKLRAVINCASKSKGTTLNDRPLQGPYWSTQLIEFLCRFRLGKVPISGGVTEIFSQMKLSEEDRDTLCFLRWSDKDMYKQAVECIMTSLLFGTASSPSKVNCATG